MQKVAVIIPCFNEVKFIEPLIKNISNQKLNGLDLEIIIVDGMSNDGTKELLDNISRKSKTNCPLCFEYCNKKYKCRYYSKDGLPYLIRR